MPSRVFARSNLGCHLSAGPPYQAATGLPRFSLAADGSCRARQVPPVHITFHQTKVLGTDTTRTGLSASAASERGAYGQVRISPSPRPAISVRIRPTRPSLCPSFSVRATLLRAHVTTAVTDMGTPGIHEEVCVCTVPHSAGLLHANHVGRITFRAHGPAGGGNYDRPHASLHERFFCSVSMLLPTTRQGLLCEGGR